mmetsp:Transcript_4006/g.10289  ORF Transcript_4006/g.10289 Transcript_4006/m.10289 type:complete len:202 (-) Transcript_4006:190-795(-)
MHHLITGRCNEALAVKGKDVGRRLLALARLELVFLDGAEALEAKVVVAKVLALGGDEEGGEPRGRSAADGDAGDEETSTEAADAGNGRSRGGGHEPQTVEEPAGEGAAGWEVEGEDVAHLAPHLLGVVHRDEAVAVAVKALDVLAFDFTPVDLDEAEVTQALEHDEARADGPGGEATHGPQRHPRRVAQGRPQESLRSERH